MYNLWWVVIGLGIATFVLIILCIVFYMKSSCFGLDCGSVLSDTFVILTGASFALVSLFAIIMPIIARDEYNEFLETKALVEQVYQGDYEQYENVGLNSKIIELNQWLVQAKANKKQYGNWSMYYALDVENLDYIVLNKTKEDLKHV